MTVCSVSTTSTSALRFRSTLCVGLALVVDMSLALPRRASVDGDGTTLLRKTEDADESRGLTADMIKAKCRTFDVEIVFSLSCDREGLTAISGLEACTNLTNLDLSQNEINRISGLHHLPLLEWLSLAGNKICRVENLETLLSLKRLDLSGNEIRRIGDLDLNTLYCLPRLIELYFRTFDGELTNPVCNRPGYRRAVIKALPNLRALDGERKLRFYELAETAVAWMNHPPEVPDVKLPAPRPWFSKDDLKVAPFSGEDLRVHLDVGALTKAIDEWRTGNTKLKERLAAMQATGGSSM